MVMPSPPGPSVGQQELAKSLIRMLKLYRGERDVRARKQIAFSIASCAVQLHDLPDAGGIPGRDGILRWRWPAPRPRAGTNPPPDHAKPAPPPPPPDGRRVVEGALPAEPEPQRCMYNCPTCGERCSWPARDNSFKCGRHQ